MTEEEKEGMAKLFESFKELVKSCEPYSNIEPVLKNTASTLSERFYQEHFIMSAILEAFFFKILFTYYLQCFLTVIKAPHYKTFR